MVLKKDWISNWYTKNDTIR